MKNYFTLYLIIGIISAFVINFVLTKNIYLALNATGPLINILIFCICSYINIIIHEFGHAIAGWIVKFPIKRITIGFGHNIFKYKFNETTLIINQGLHGGLTHPGTVSADFLRIRYFFFALGGVGLQAIAIALVIATQTIYPLAFHTNHLLLTISNIFVFSNFLLIFINLFPFKANMLGIPMPTDGLQLLTIFFKNQEEIQEILLAGKVIEGLEHLEERNFQQAEVIFRDCIIKSPKLLIPKVNLSVALIRQQKLDDAIGLLAELLTELDQNPMRLFVFNNLAWSYLLKGVNQPEFLKIADEYSDQAIKITNQSPNLIGTRACVLIEIGKIDEGIKLLKNQVSLNHAVNDTTNSVIGFLYLAYAYYLQGNEKQFKKYWQKINKHEDLEKSEYKLLCDHVLKKTNYFTMP